MVMAHLFRKNGREVAIEDAVSFLSFRCRYGAPTEVRKLLSIALENEMISREKDSIIAGFLFNLSTALQDKVRFTEEIKPMY